MTLKITPSDDLKRVTITGPQPEAVGIDGVHVTVSIQDFENALAEYYHLAGPYAPHRYQRRESIVQPFNLDAPRPCKRCGREPASLYHI